MECLNLKRQLIAFTSIRALKLYLGQNGFHSADKVGKEIIAACADLKFFPNKGLSAAERFGIDTDMKYLVLGKNIVFYRVHEEIIEIIRLFDTRMNVLFRMFGIDMEDSESEEFGDE